MTWRIDQSPYLERLNQSLLHTRMGRITKSIGLTYEAYLPGASVGSLCRILASHDLDSDLGFDAEVVGFRDKRALLMPYDDAAGVNTDSLVVLKERSSTVSVGDALVGRVLDGKGDPIDGKGPLIHRLGQVSQRSLYQKPTHPLERQKVEEPLDLGIRSINGLLTCGKGQRLAIMAGSGVGKSVLLGMMAQHTKADINVIALIGERGREVREFIENDLGPEGLKRSVVIVSTSDRSPLLRMRGAYLAATVAEYFRDQGKDVLFLMDSVTRFCMAQREIGLSLGEPPASRGFTPSVFSSIPKLLERAGMAPVKGSITGLFSVLVESEEMDDPIADAVRSILDGHIVLSRTIAQKNHFPAIDVLKSASRVMRSVITQDHVKWAGQIKEWIANYQEAEDLINIGAYVRGSNPKVDQAIAVRDKINDFLKQGMGEKASFSDTLAQLHSIVRLGESHLLANQAVPEGKRGQGGSSQVRF
ncbi:MAG: FliI/YscN family ATPase [Bdellovibrionia bacterium]